MVNKKAEYNIEGILISVAMITVFFATILAFHGEVNDNFTIHNYYEQNFSEYQVILNKVQNNSEDVSNAFTKLASGNLLDIFGGLIQGLVSTMLIFFDSFVGLKIVFSQSIGIFELGDLGSLWIAVSAIAIVLVFIVGIIRRQVK